MKLLKGTRKWVVLLFCSKSDNLAVAQATICALAQNKTRKSTGRSTFRDIELLIRPESGGKKNRSRVDFSDGQFLIAMRCQWFYHNSDAMSMFLAIS